MSFVTANQLAGSDQNDQKSFRKALRSKNFEWHETYEKWTVELDSREHELMKQVFDEWSKRKR